jgi:YidC/Oxa1 family membrane protein insertase
MDYQRIFILLGLAVTAYLLVLEWNKDYGQGAKVPVSQEIQSDASVSTGALDDLLPTAPTAAQPVPGDMVPGSSTTTPADIVPSIDPVPQAAESITPVDTNRYLVVSTDVLNVRIDKLGGDIVSVSLPAYPATLESPDVPFILVDPKNAYSAQSGLIGPNGTDTASGRPMFTARQSRYELGDSQSVSVELSLPDNGDGVTVTKTFTFSRSNYLIDITYAVSNNSSASWSAAVFAQIKRDGKDPINVDTNAMGMQPYIGGASRTPEASYQKLEFDDLEEETYQQKFTGGYMAMVQHYFISAFVPASDVEHNYQARKLPGQDIYLLGFTSPLWTVPAGAIASQSVKYYAGPKDQYALQDIAEGLDLTIDYGFLWWLAQPLFYLLTFIQTFVVNWGVAIMLLTLVVKMVLYPLSAASFRSNAKLRKLQPQLLRLKEQHGDDKQKFSQEMMNLYKKEGANPLGGCLPLLLQMPVFIALYWVLLESVEIRQAPFALWITDLSTKDPYFVLPILMGISMYFVTMMQPTPPDPMQAKIFKMMPIMFTFFFLWFPAGLVLYWLVNNVLSISQQWYVTRQLDKSD